MGCVIIHIWKRTHGEQKLISFNDLESYWCESVDTSGSHSWFPECSGAPSSDSSILVKMSAPPFFFFMGHNFSITPHLLRRLLPLLLSASGILHWLHLMSGLISCNYGVISVAIIGSVCSEKVMRDMTRYLPRRIIICIYRGRYRALSSEFRRMDMENSNKKEEERTFHVHWGVRPVWRLWASQESFIIDSFVIWNDWNSPSFQS